MRLCQLWQNTNKKNMKFYIFYRLYHLGLIILKRFSSILYVLNHMKLLVINILDLNVMILNMLFLCF